MTPGWLKVMMSSCLVLGGAGSAEAETANRIVAVVNEEVVTEGDVRAFLNAMDEPPPEVSPESIRAVALKQLIGQRLIIQEAKRLNLTVSPNEVAQRLDEVRGRFPTREDYQQMLRISGLSEERLKLRLREQLLAQKAIDVQVRAKIVVSPAEVAAAMARRPSDPAGPPESEASPASGPVDFSEGGVSEEREFRLYHLLVRLGPRRVREQAEELARSLRSRMMAGEDFERLAREHSEGPHAAAGGFMGWMRAEELLPELSRAVTQMRPGEISEPIETALGFHLLRVAEERSRQGVEEAESEAVRRIRARLYQRKFADTMDRWLEKLSEHAYIEVAGD